MVSGREGSGRPAAEAAAWLARLESTGRTEATEAGLRTWLEADAEHRDAFEKAMDVWAIIPGAALFGAETGEAREARHASTLVRRLPVHARSLAIAASLFLLCLVSGWLLLRQPPAYSTAVGEQQVATLEDGSRIALNTDTHLSVAYKKASRDITLDDGEAMFEVAHNAARPFVVTAGDKSVTAVGTSFIVRKKGDAVTVTLISGKVRIDTRPSADKVPAGLPTLLAPGEQFAAIGDASAMVTSVSSDAATAWRRGQVVFNDTPLSAAIAELHRYGGPQIRIDDPRLGALKVSGVFATNDVAEFVDAVATLHGLKVERGSRQLRLER